MSEANKHHLRPACLLVAIVPMIGVVAAAPVPADYHGMWAAGSCATPKFHMHIENTGIQLYEPDKRTPAGDWDVSDPKKVPGGTGFTIKDTNAGTKSSIEFVKLANGRLAFREKGATVSTVELEKCAQ